MEAERALAWLPRKELTDRELEHVTHGRAIPAALEEVSSGLPVALVHGNRLVGVGRKESGLLKPEKVFAHA